MTTDKLMCAAVALGLPLGVIGAIGGWSSADGEGAIAIATAIAVIVFIWLPDAIRGARKP